MTPDIASQVKSLGDFPLDPDAGQSWLWTGDGTRLLWLSKAAAERLEFVGAPLDAIAHGNALESFAAELRNLQPDHQPIRVKQLPLSFKGQSDVFTCLCRHVPLADGGGFGLLTVAIGAPPRLKSNGGTAQPPAANQQQGPTPADVTAGNPYPAIKAGNGVQPAATEPKAPDLMGLEALDLQKLGLEKPGLETPTVAPVPLAPTQATPAASDPATKTARPEATQVRRVEEKPEQHTPTRAEAAPSPAPLLPVLTPLAGRITIPTHLKPAPPPPVPPTEPPLPTPRRQARDALDAPGWLGAPPERRRPLRFVWQTDAAGRFVHLSRELADAVGPASAAILGRDWASIVSTLGLTETEDMAAGLAAQQTFTAKPVLWPVQGSTLGVPVEMAGLPVREDGAFAGFRGYGIARIERASAQADSAAAALGGESHPPTDSPDERFGPAIAEVLAQTPPEMGNVAEADDGLPMTAATAAVEAPQPAMANPSSQTQPAQPADEASSLTVSERNAFREIARALGRDSIGQNSIGRDSIAREEAAPTSTAPLDEPVPASPRQMPAWIARRQQVLQEPPPAPAASEPSAPVVPFEALQSRIERRSRDVVQSANQSATAAIIDKLPLAVLVMQQGKALFANQAFLDLAGHGDFAGFTAAGGVEQLFTAEPSLVPPGRANTITIRGADGSLRPVEAQITAITWDGASAALITFRSIEAVQQARSLDLELQAARAELRELRFVLDTATDGVLSLDGEGRILAANRSAEALFGFDQNEITGEPFTLLLEPESHAAALDYLEGLKTEGVATIMNDGRDVFGRERHGGRIPLFMTLGRMGGAQNDRRFCAVLRDVTIWKKAEAELTDARQAAEDSSANKTDFLARISHEIRTPMNAIIGFADVMRSETFGPLGNERYRGYVNDIHASGQHVVSLVNDLLDLSKVASGKLDLTFGSVNLNEAVTAAVSMIQPQANAGKVIIRTQLSPTLPPVVADERSMRQIVLNLLSNAAKFTEPGGQVIVTTALTERGEAVIRVRDTGIGMSADELKKAIEPFRQIPGPKAQGGTGLGLPLTKALAEANRAQFALSSEPKKGTLAEVMFPSTRVLAE